VRAFVCAVCGRLLVFENSVCVSCGTAQGFDAALMRLVPVPTDASAVPCANLHLASCNWLVPRDEVGVYGGLCRVCRLTRTRPADSDAAALVAFARTEAAKRRLVYQLLDLGLPVVPKTDDDKNGLAFDLLSSAYAPVVTGHAEGVVTIDLAEGHDAHREALRVEMAEPYRTLLGHVRHETGHYYWSVLVEGSALVDGELLVDGDLGALARFRELFGDERADYRQALQRHYRDGPPPSWNRSYVSAYATAHPWEDWAETFAHYLHIADTLQSAAAYGMVVTGPDVTVADAQALVALPREDSAQRGTLQNLVGTWLPLTYALNAVNRSMGKGDLYPFLLTPSAIRKLSFVHDLVQAAHARAR
jgi:hypothetical protein